MAIHMTPCPEEGATVVERNLVLPDGDTNLMMMNAEERGERAGRARPRITERYAVFSAQLEDVLPDGRGLLQADRPTSWQYVVRDRNGVIVALSEVANGTPCQYASQQSPVVAEAVLKAIQDAEKLDAVKQSDYELRILRVPELYLLAVWLHAPNDDVLLPVRPFTRILGDGSSFTEKQVVAALRPLAQVRAATPDA